jgi:alpha-galactosidase
VDARGEFYNLGGIRDKVVRDTKITLIGAGSPTFSPFLFENILQGNLPRECNLEVSLLTVHSKTVRAMHKILEKIHSQYQKNLRAQNQELPNVKITSQLDLGKALEGSDFVLTTIGAGGFKATQDDIVIPERLGIYQTVGDMVGPGGAFRGLRHIPVIMEVARMMEDKCPSATLFNYTNPMTPVTRAVARESKIRVFGLCSSPWYAFNYFANFFHVDQRDLDMTIAGINHLCFITDLEVNGHPSLEELARRLPKERFGPVSRELYALTGLIPYAGDRHTAEFFPRLYLNSKSTLQKYHLLPNMLTATDRADRLRVEKIVSKILADDDDIQKLLDLRGFSEEGKCVSRIFDSLMNSKRSYFAGINVPNNGSIENLPSNSLIEVTAEISKSGVVPRKIGRKIPDDLAAVLQSRLEQYELLIDAALSGDRSILLRSLQLDGYIKSLEQGRKLIDNMLRAERKWLPEYWFGNKTN